MSILSGVILMVAIGTVVQKSDQLTDWFGGSRTQPNLVADAAEAGINDLVLIDVLANDEALPDWAGERLVVTRAPTCGRIFVQDGVIQYLADAACIGEQTFSYGLRNSDIAPAKVALSIRRESRKIRNGIGGAPRLDMPEPAAPAAAGEPGPVALAEPAATAPSAVKAAEQAPRGAEGKAAEPVPAKLHAAEAPAPVGAASPAALAAAGTGADDSAALAVAADGGAGRTAGLASTPRQPEPPRDPAVDAAQPAAAVQPRTDFAGIAAPGAPELIDELDRIAAAPVPRERPAVSPSAPAADGPEAVATRPATPAVPRPGLINDPGAPRQSDIAGELAFAGSDTLSGSPDANAPQAPDDPAAPGAAALVPERLDSDPVGDTEPVVSATVGVLAGFLGTGEAVDHRPSFAPGTDIAGERGEPAVLGGGMSPSMALARIDVPHPGDVRSGAPAPTVDLATGERIVLTDPPAIGAATDSEIALVAPASGLGPVRGLGDALTLAPVDTSEPPPLAAPAAPAADAPLEVEPTETAALGNWDANPEAGGDAPLDEPAARSEAADERLAALPPADAACVVPPSLTVDAGRAAVTAIDVVSPCHAGSAVAMDYGELSLGFGLDADGRGRIALPGFAHSMDAVVTFADGTALKLTVPFQGVERVERVAVSWDLPVRLDLHALEFGAGAGEDGHVGPENPRSFEAVRRTGGGFLQSFDPVDGVGQHVRVYTHYLRPGAAGIVKMMIDFASRREGAGETCGQGDLASPGFRVIRSARGVVERPQRGRLAALGCNEIAEGGDRLISNAVSNLVISY